MRRVRKADFAALLPNGYGDEMKAEKHGFTGRYAGEYTFCVCGFGGGGNFKTYNEVRQHIHDVEQAECEDAFRVAISEPSADR